MTNLSLYRRRVHPAACILIVTTVLVTFFVSSCNKADNFYDKLQALPQIMNTPAYAYKTTYIVGDTLVITGKLQPQTEDFSVTIGGIKASIAAIKTISAAQTPRDQVAVLISAEMVGQQQEVKVTSGGYTTTGANIDVYAESGEGSFEAILSNRTVANFPNGNNIFLHCINGKGDVYYYSPAAKKIYHIKKDGTQTQVFDLANAVQPGNIFIDEFISGGVSSDGGTLYFSAKTLTGGYLFARISLSSGVLTLINQSTVLAAPFEGKAASANMVVSDIYPVKNGGVYLGIGFSTGQDGSYVPGAIARYQSSDNSVKYLFKDRVFAGSYPDMPGTPLSFFYLIEFRVSADEGLLYLMQESFMGPSSTVIDVYDLPSASKIQTLNANTGRGDALYDVLNTFSSLGISLAFNQPQTAFGYMPMPGRRLQVLMYQQIAGSTSIANNRGFPRWIVLDFQHQRTYAYAQDRFRTGGNSFNKNSQRNDELLNYDEDGNLYATANNRAVLLATRAL
ncbi:MAG TPA: hypothetical protein ENO28_18280 [Bacteroidetes bacterium]|nr:hypothetical protein [Bacteroidota bacterium]